MHIRFTLGGRYTHIVFDVPVPVMDWVWDRVKQKYFLKKEENENIEKLKEARRIFEQAANLQVDIAKEAADKLADVVEFEQGLKDLEKARKSKRKGRKTKNKVA